jgi:hypothetical protein
MAKYGLTALFVTVIFLIFLASPLTGQRVCCEGDMWLRWNLHERQIFVAAYTLGYQTGIENGCEIGASSWPVQPGHDLEGDRHRKCLATVDFSKPSEDYVNLITGFYKRYPGDRDIYPQEVLEQIGKGLTIEQIHNHPFMRHVSPAGSTQVAH